MDYSSHLDCSVYEVWGSDIYNNSICDPNDNLKERLSFLNSNFYNY